MSKQVQMTQRDMYLAIFDAAVEHRTLRVSDLANLAQITTNIAYKFASDILADNALIELDANDSSSAADIKLLCSDSERMSRADADRKFCNLFRAAAAAQSSTAAAETTTATATVKHTATRAAAAAAAQQSITLATRDSKKQTATTTTTDQRYLTSYVEHRYERKNVMCACCLREYAHTITHVAVCSICYNAARRVAVEMKSTAAVVRALSLMTDSEQRDFIKRVRVLRQITLSMSKRAETTTTAAELTTAAS